MSYLKDKLRILWSSNGIMSSSGYGNQSREILSRMASSKFPTAQQAFFGLQGGIIELDGVRIYPKLDAPWGEDGLIKHAEDFKADVVFTFQDVFVLNPSYMPKVKNWIAYTPVDGDPVPKEIIKRLNMAYEIITMSKFGQKMLQKSGFASTYIPLGVDTKVFNIKDKQKARKMFGIPEDKFVFGMIAANKDNPSRKSYQQVLEAFAKFAANHDDALLFVHTNLMGGGGFPIEQYAEHLNIKDKIFRLDPYTTQFKLGKEEIAWLHNAFDVFLNPSSREGFGLGIVEAQACGRPVIVTDAMSMPELLGCGYKVKVGHKLWVGLETFMEFPDPDDLHKKMEMLYKDVLRDEDKLRKKARKFALQYDMGEVYDKMWLPYLEKLEKRLKGKDERHDQTNRNSKVETNQ